MALSSRTAAEELSRCAERAEPRGPKRCTSNRRRTKTVHKLKTRRKVPPRFVNLLALPSTLPPCPTGTPTVTPSTHRPVGRFTPPPRSARYPVHRPLVGPQVTARPPPARGTYGCLPGLRLGLGLLRDREWNHPVHRAVSDFQHAYSE